MSGVYIKGMQIPENCSECPINMSFCKRGYQYLLEHTELYDRRADDCHIISVPDHGDLIDRDIYRASIRESLEECNKWANEVDNDTMMYARISQSVGTFVECSLRAKGMPTVIPADKEEFYETTI